MEVSDGEIEKTPELEVELGGQELVQTVLSLTGLPESMIRNELEEILEVAGQSTQDLTLQQLRMALVAHLEALQADFFQDSSLLSE